ncbi:MAG: hypothetical protein NTZ93_01815 [Candidatus Beckwithbacteria bacterium]|nr:hypothetical protein [Candidatus Beckwithbacteria bacterium]
MAQESGQEKIKTSLSGAISEWEPSKLREQGDQGEEIFKDLLYVAVGIKDKNSFLECMRVADKGVLSDDAFWRVITLAASEVDFKEYDEEIKTILTRWHENEVIYQEYSNLLFISLLKFDSGKIETLLPKFLNFLDIDGNFDIDPHELIEGVVTNGKVEINDLRSVLGKYSNESAKKLLSVIPA